MSFPRLLYRNVLKDAEDGHGDGTYWGDGTGIATGGIDVDANTFEDNGSLNIVTAITDADDVFNGYLLVFEDSGNKYHIYDYVKAVTGTGAIFYTVETPDVNDNGAYYITRSLYVNNQDPDYPITNICDDRIYTQFKMDDHDNDLNIKAFAPNLLRNGGFEEDSISPWSGTGDSGYAVTRDTSTPLRGSVGVTLTQGTTYVRLHQSNAYELKKGKKYVLSFLADSSSGSGYVRVEFWNVAGGANFHADENINWDSDSFLHSNDTDNGDGTILLYVTSSEAWKQAVFTIPEDVDVGEMQFYFEWEPSASETVRLDGFYMWEFSGGVNNGAVFTNTNINGIFVANSWVSVTHLDPDEASYSNSVDRESGLIRPFIDLDGAYDGDRRDPFYDWDTNANNGLNSEFVRHTPIVSFVLDTSVSNIYIEIGELWVGHMWHWSKKPNPPFINLGPKVRSVTNKSRGGVKSAELVYHQREFSGAIDLMDQAEASKWNEFIIHSGHGAPAWLIIPTVTTFGIEEECLFISCKKPPSLTWGTPLNYKVSFDFEEAF